MAADYQAFERGQRVPGSRPSGPGALRRFVLSSMASISYPGSQAEQLLLAPQELRTADPSFATELYNGHFGLAGRLAPRPERLRCDPDAPGFGAGAGNG